MKCCNYHQTTIFSKILLRYKVLLCVLFFVQQEHLLLPAATTTTLNVVALVGISNYRHRHQKTDVHNDKQVSRKGSFVINMVPITRRGAKLQKIPLQQTILSPSSSVATSASNKNDADDLERDVHGNSETFNLSISSDVQNSINHEELQRLYNDWINHSDETFHHFSSKEASEIRQALLTWYRQHRRKLPWRGDAPPFDGSTAGIATATNTKKQKNQRQQQKTKEPRNGETTDETTPKKQSNITSFFTSTSPAALSSNKKATTSPSTRNKDKALPIPDLEQSTSKLQKGNPDEIDVENESPLPRDDSTDGAIPVSAYGVWVSEIMLQQTRVEAVIPYWIKWMKSFPTVHHLAEATEEQVNAHWAGLGFYRRARLLHQGAKHVVQEHQGELPKTVPELLKITGIGPYTASAIASIAFDVCVPVVDGNVCRVLSRLTGIANHIKAPVLKDKLGWTLAEQIIQAGNDVPATSSSLSTNSSTNSSSSISSPSSSCAGEVNQALMELGATYCAPSGSGIDPRDPLRDFYMSTKLGRAYYYQLLVGGKSHLVGQKKKTGKGSCKLCASNDESSDDGITTVLEEFRAKIHRDMSWDDAAVVGHSIFPLDPPKSKRREEDLAVAVLCNEYNDETWWLLVRRPPEGLLAGQWEFPSVCVQTRKKGTERPPSAKRRQEALTEFLQQVLTAQADDDDDGGDETEQHVLAFVDRTSIQPAPLEHIFSHVKHIMWIETATISLNIDDRLEWISAIKTNKSTRRQVRWMRESDMAQVGITSGVKKVLQTVKKKDGMTAKTKRKATNATSRKRKR